MSKLYLSDCTDVLDKLLLQSVDLIYIDVPFNTKRTMDFDDDLGSVQQAMEYYQVRLEKMHRVLKQTGLVYVHCDFRLSHSMKLMLDVIFGEKNFRNEIIWYYNSSSRGKKDFGRRHDTIFRYSISNEYYFNGASPYIRQPYSNTAPRGYEKERYYHPAGKVMDDVWHIPMIAQNDKKERCGYSTQKPINLLLPIIDSSCPPHGIVADFFCGSGTTLVAAKLLGREYLGCDINNKAFELAQSRLEHTAKGDL